MSQIGPILYFWDIIFFQTKFSQIRPYWISLLGHFSMGALRCKVDSPFQGKEGDSSYPAQRSNFFWSGNLPFSVVFLAFLAGHSAKALTPPGPLPVSGKIAILCKFFFIYIYMDIGHIYVFKTRKLRHGKWH